MIYNRSPKIKKNDLIIGFEVKGHTGKANRGEDLLCAQISTVAQLAKTLEENCNLNDTAARTARIDAECNERFISSQMTKKNQFDEAINQVDTILGFANVEEHSRGRRAA